MIAIGRVGLLATAVLLASCVVAEPSASSPMVATPQAAGASASPSPTQAPMAKPAGSVASLLLVRIEEPGVGVLRARPIDPGTLADIPGFTPLELGHHYRSALSPDRRTLAVFVWPPSGGGSGAGGVLHLVDPLAWTDRTTDVRVDENFDWLEWSANGKSLYWIRAVQTELHAVFATDLATLTIREIARLPAGFQPFDTRLVGSRIAVVGATNDRNLAQGDAGVVFVDTSSGRVSPQLRLSGMRLGQFAVNEPGLYPYRMIVPGKAWDLERGRLVLVDAERDVVHVIDLLHETESGPLAIRPRSTSKGPPGGAKMVSTTRKVAALSGDGRWLYVSGSREDVSTNDPEHVVVVPIAVQRVDLSSMSETARVAGGAPLLRLSSNGTRLLYAGDDTVVLDATDLHEIIRVATQRETGAMERDGIAYITYSAYPSGSSLRAVAFLTGNVLASRTLDRHVADLIDIR